MFNILKFLFTKSKKKRTYKSKNSVNSTNTTNKKVEIKEERNIRECHCGRRTLIKNHTKIIDKKGNVSYEFHIICPNCGNNISGIANKLDDAKNIAISKWNRSNHMNSVLVRRGYKQIEMPSKMGRPHKA